MSNDLLKLENVYFYYVKIAEPQVDKFDPTGLTKKYGAAICLSKDQAKEFKRLKLNKTVKEFTAEEFEKTYKVAPPPEFANEDDEYFTITFSLNGTYKDGNPIPEWAQPKTYLLEDGAPVDRSKTLVGNGSKGDIRVKTKQSQTGSINTYLHSILVRDLIPVEKRGDEWATPAATKSASVSDDDLPF